MTSSGNIPIDGTRNDNDVNDGNGNHKSALALGGMQERIEELRKDPIFGDTPGETSDNRMDLMRLIMSELLQGNRQKPRSEQEECSNMFKKFASHKPPTYDGKPGPNEFEEWISDMEKLFDATQCPEKWKVNYAVFYLKGQANLWWKSVKGIQNEPGFGWEKLTEAMREQFYPYSLQLQMESEFIKLSQGKKNVLEYAVKFNELARFAPDLVTTDRQRMNRFEGGLSIEIRDRLSSSRISTFQELYDRAINVERIIKLREETYGKRKGSFEENQPNNKKQNVNVSYQGGNNGNQNFNKNRGCAKCGRWNHTEKECRIGTRDCFKCGSKDHQIRDCPQIHREQGDRRNDENKGNGGTTNFNRNPPRGATSNGRVFLMQGKDDDANDNDDFASME
ncbi:uncharacterized protein [Spinacia oleracea]|uniref:CCHC-type domain-containing protein n=1 Tax=Spinacia oleracea TaxID=3562 RepID=A0A9R0I1I8_SPIOL|nr:uncharacterized protein LOC110780855 [Spinacia oleracea]